MHILFFIGTLEIGGAERQIAQLAYHLAQSGKQVSVVTIYPGGQNWDWLQAHARVRLRSLFSKKPRSKFLTGIQLAEAPLYLRHLLQEEKPLVIYSALYMSNWIAWVAVQNLSRVKLIWGIRASNLQFNWKRALPFYLCKWVSGSVPLIVANSKVGLAYHQDQGYRSQTTVVIPNGIDTSQFYPDRDAGLQVRFQWGVSPSEKLIGLVGRLDPMKDHPTFLKAAAILSQQRESVRFVCVGSGSENYQKQLYQLTESLGIADKVIWAGARSDMLRVYNAFQIASSSSSGEGFANVIAEAMACGVPCVVTDVGDSAWIVGDTGIVVPPCNPQSLAESWLYCFNQNQDLYQMGLKARVRIEQRFSIDILVEKTLKEIC